MNAQKILDALKSLLPMLEPLALQEFENVVLPALGRIEQNSIHSPDLQVLADAIIAAIKAIGEKEIPKI